MSARGTRVALAALVGAAFAGGIGQAAWGETYRVDDPVLAVRLVEVGINGGNANSGALVGISQGGCTQGFVVVGIGNPSNCPQYWYYPPADNEGEVLAVGLLGGGAQGPVAVSDSGPANGRCLWPVTILGCLIGTPPYGVGVAGAGNASGTVAVSGTGHATATGPSGLPGGPNVAVSGTGTATSSHVAVAGGDANAPGGLVAVSATGEAHGALVNVAPLEDAGR